MPSAISPPHLPVSVPLATEPLGVFGTLRAGRRNILELIPEIATRAPILTNTRGLPWTEDGLRTSWGKAFDKTDLGDLHFHDLRGTQPCANSSL